MERGIENARIIGPVSTVVFTPLFMALTAGILHVMFGLVGGGNGTLPAGLRDLGARRDHQRAAGGLHHDHDDRQRPGRRRQSRHLRADARGNQLCRHVSSSRSTCSTSGRRSARQSAWPCSTSGAPRPIAMTLFAIYLVIALIIGVISVRGRKGAGMSRKKKILITLAVVIVGGAVVGANLYFKREQGVTVTTEAIRARDLEAIVVGVRQDPAEAAGQHLGQPDGPGDAARGRGRPAGQGRPVPARDRPAVARRPAPARRGQRRGAAVAPAPGARPTSSRRESSLDARRSRTSSASRSSVQGRPDHARSSSSGRRTSVDAARGRPQGARSRRSRHRNSRSSRSRPAWRRRGTT